MIPQAPATCQSLNGKHPLSIISVLAFLTKAKCSMQNSEFTLQAILCRSSLLIMVLNMKAPSG